MRELKFRAWNTEIMQFEYFELHNITVPDRLLCQYKYPVQQFTGLKDKNGKEIYEGDIVNIFNHNQAEEVMYEPCGTAFGFFKHDSASREDGTFEVLSDYTGCDGYEIIGNIFENNELLEA